MIKRLEARHGNSQRKLQQKIEEQEKTIGILKDKIKTVNLATKTGQPIWSTRKQAFSESKLRILRQRHKRLYEEKQEIQDTADVRLRRSTTQKKLKFLKTTSIS